MFYFKKVRKGCFMVAYPDEGRGLNRKFEWAEPRKEVIIRLRKPKRSNKPFIVLGIIGFLLLIALTSAKPQMIPMKQQIVETYTDHEPRTITQNVNTTEFYRETEKISGAPPCFYRNYEFEQKFSYEYQIINNSVYLNCTLALENKEKQTGEWRFYVMVQKYDGRLFESNIISRNVTGNSTEIFTWLFPLDALEQTDCKLKAEAIPSDWMCNTEVLSISDKSRTTGKDNRITIFVDVQKTRNITKEINTTVYINRMFGYMQPFWLGY